MRRSGAATGYSAGVDSPETRAETEASRPADPPPLYFEARTELADRFLTGKGLEIGALNWPLKLPAGAEAKTVDRMPLAELREEYPELQDQDLSEVDILDDGEKLESIPERSQDFIIANHFLEHTGDPIGTIGVHLGKLKPGGVLFYAVPDQRYTFDFRREPTSLEHMIRDHEEGAEVSRRAHYDEWANLVVANEEYHEDPAWPARAEEVARELEDEDFSIHTHSWTEASFMRLLLYCQERFDDSFEIEALARRGIEIVVVLRKSGASPQPTTSPELAAEVQRLRSQVRRLESDLDSTARELRRVKSSSSWRVTEPLRAAKARLGGRR